MFEALLGVLFGCGIFAPWALQAATDNQLAVNADTGLAISGFDPVAYFTDGKAVFGRPEIELNLDGVIWRFSNEGNRGAFAVHPEVYAPRFGGYDPVAIGGDRSVAGHPLFWVVVGQRLYLFYSEKSRAAFLADPGRIINTAERKWPEVARNLGH
ncbi:MAG TPA: YHS domain-containing (seleno)protein [Pseudolabrys sp.]